MHFVYEQVTLNFFHFQTTKSSATRLVKNEWAFPTDYEANLILLFILSKNAFIEKIGVEITVTWVVNHLQKPMRMPNVKIQILSLNPKVVAIPSLPFWVTTWIPKFKQEVVVFQLPGTWSKTDSMRLSLMDALEVNSCHRFWAILFSPLLTVHIASASIETKGSQWGLC